MKVRHFTKEDIFAYLRENTEKFIGKMSRKISRRYDKFYGNEPDVAKAVKAIADNMVSSHGEEDFNIQEIKASEITNGDMMVFAAVRRDVDVKVDMDEITKAQWIDADVELPTEEDLYFILTDDHLTRGYAWFGIQEEGDTEPRFDVWYATGAVEGVEPKVKYWLKDHHWGLVYDFKMKAGEIK